MSDELIRSLRGRLSDAEEAVRLGVAMRERQAEYFRSRSREALIASKQAETAFDKAAMAALAGADPSFDANFEKVFGGRG